MENREIENVQNEKLRKMILIELSDILPPEFYENEPLFLEKKLEEK